MHAAATSSFSLSEEPRALVNCSLGPLVEMFKVNEVWRLFKLSSCGECILLLIGYFEVEKVLDDSTLGINPVELVDCIFLLF